MTLLVQKYGGSSVASTDKLRRVAERIARTRQAGHDVVAVVSAMGRSTDELLGLAGQVAEQPSRRELDLLLSAGEQVSSSLLALALHDLGVESVALTGRQVGIRASGPHGNADIEHVDTRRPREELAAGRVVVVAGYQGVDQRGEVRTLGRGGSDTTAVALAAALRADRCQILSDVDGVYSADPRVVPGARKLERISHHEMQELARHGARVLNQEAVRVAREKGVVIEAAASFQDGDGTRVEPDDRPAAAEDGGAAAARGVAWRDDVAWVRGRTADPSGRLRSELAEALGELELLHACEGDDERPPEMVVSLENEPEPRRLRELVLRDLGGAAEVFLEVGAVAAVGHGVGGCPRVAERVEKALGQQGLGLRRRLPRPHAWSGLVDEAKTSLVGLALHEALLGDGEASKRAVS